MGTLRRGSVVLLAAIAFGIAAGVQTGTAAAAGLPSSPGDLSQQSTPSSTSPGAASDASVGESIQQAAPQIALPGGGGAALATATQDASDVASTVGAAVESATAAAADTVDTVTQEVGLPQSGSGDSPASSGPPEPPAQSGRGSTSTPSPGQAAGGSSTGTGSSTGQPAPSAQAPAGTPASDPASVAPPDSVAASPDPAAPTEAPAAGSKLHPAAATAAHRDPARKPVPKASVATVGGLVGGTPSPSAVQTNGGQRADTTASTTSKPGDTTARRATRGPPSPLAPLKQVVLKILPPQLPGATLGHNLAGDSALVMRIAKLLAAVYAAFLIVWFWATRVRWNGR